MKPMFERMRENLSLKQVKINSKNIVHFDLEVKETQKIGSIMFRINQNYFFSGFKAS